MSEVLLELELICRDCLKLKNSIYKNEIIFNATKDQEDSFYRMLDSLINRLESYMSKFESTNHVFSGETFAFSMEEKNKSKGISYEFPKMRENLNNYYREFKDIHDDDTNFIAATIVSVLAPLRLIAEKMYQDLTGRPFDTTLTEKDKLK